MKPIVLNKEQTEKLYVVLRNTKPELGDIMDLVNQSIQESESCPRCKKDLNYEFSGEVTCPKYNFWEFK